MKMLHLNKPSGRMAIVISKISGIVENKSAGTTDIFTVGDDSPYSFKKPYEEIMKAIEEVENEVDV